MIGMSIYPYWDIDTKLQTTWQGTVDGFVSNIKRLYKKYGSETMIVETGVEAKKPVLGKEILDAIIDAAYSRCDGHCKGVFYWAPEAEGAYPLGAFDGNKPTVIMDSFTEMARKLKQ
jgi:arabinogalactan endo-1,4-beta-galactosidase